MKDGENMKNVIIIVLSIFVIVLSSYIILEKVKDSKELNIIDKQVNDTVKEDDNKELEDDINVVSSSYTTKCNTDEEKTFIVYGNVDNYSNIYQYISNNEDISVKLGYCSNEVISDGEGPTFFKTNYYDLTDEEITTYLNEMKDKGSSKYLTGGYGPSCDNSIYISYKFNNNEHTLKIGLNSQILNTTDGNIYKIIDMNSNDEIPEYCLYSAGSDSTTINNIRQALYNSI